MILVDTSVWIAYLRGDDGDGADTLAVLLDRDAPICITSFIALELLQGVPDGQAARRLETYLSTQRRLESLDPWETAVAAARLYGACRNAGYTVRSTVDCWIAQLAIEHGAALLHQDRDFEHIRRVAPELETLAYGP